MPRKLRSHTMSSEDSEVRRRVLEQYQEHWAEIARAERELRLHWTTYLADPRELKLGEFKQLQIEFERCCEILDREPGRADTDLLRMHLFLIREHANGYTRFLESVDEALKMRFSAAAIEQAIMNLGQRPELSPRKAELLTLPEAATMLEQLRPKPVVRLTDDELNDTDWKILRALGRLNAFDRQNRTTRAKVGCDRIERVGNVDSQHFENSIAKLKRLQLIETARGPMGGVWMTPEGKKLLPS
jgi:hypothetical protein